MVLIESCDRAHVFDTICFRAVWLNLLLISSFGNPAKLLLEKHPRVQQLISRATAFVSHAVQKFKPSTSNQPSSEQDPYKEALKVPGTLKNCDILSCMCMQGALKRQSAISANFTVLLSVLVFGQICPPLLIAVPVWAFAQHYTTGWLQQCGLRSVGDKVADQILVQSPSTVFEVCARLGQCGVAALIFIDLEFEVGPVILYCALSIAFEVGNLFWHRRNVERSQVANHRHVGFSKQVRCINSHQSCPTEYSPLLLFRPNEQVQRCFGHAILIILF